MKNILQKVINEAELISLPEVYLRLREILNDPDFTLAEVARVISKDPSITLRLLGIVNSSLYGFSTKVETVGRAITMLGTQQIHDLVLATSVARAFAGVELEIMDVHRFWRKSLFCAIASQYLVSACNNNDKKELIFVAGLLHDIGHLLMYQSIPQESMTAISQANDEVIPVFLAERKLLQFDYATVGSTIISQWELPEVLVEVAKHHVEPEVTQPYALETVIVHIASDMANAYDAGASEEKQHLLDIDSSLLSFAKLTIEQCVEVKDLTLNELDNTTSLIFGLTRMLEWTGGSYATAAERPATQPVEKAACRL